MLRWLLSAFGMDLMKGEIAARLERAGRRAGLAVLAGLLWLVAVGFAVAAVVAWLSQQLGPVAALAIVAGAVAIVAIIVQVTLRLSRGPGRPAASSPLSGLGVDEIASASPVALVAVVAFLGYLLGRQTTRR